jgi:pimeloyl-ACP methyl ester carboxylesterase
MRKTVHTLSITAVIVGTVLAGSFLSGSFASGSAAGQPGPAWRPCPTTPGVALDPRQQCTTINVPMDYQHPTGQQISLAISRINTATPNLRRGVLLLIPGGPGNPGLNQPSSQGLTLPAQVLDRYDIIGFDPRGTGRSTPVSCQLESRDANPFVFLPWPGPNGDISANVDRARRIATACAQHGGELIRHITTRNEARDIDQIRRALGEQRLSYWGTSYGTYAGSAYATMFPDHTDRIVLDSNDDPNPSLAERGLAANFAIGAENRFPDFAAWTATRDSTYQLGTTATAVRDTYLRLAATLDRTPLPDLTGNALRALMFNTLYSDAGFPLLAQLMHAARTGTPLPGIPLPPAAQFQNLIAVQTATGCNDVTWPRSINSYATAVAHNRIAFPLTAGMPVNIWPCAFWPYPVAEPPVRITPNGPSNVLMIQNLRDPATPYTGALKLRAAFGNRARLITVDSGGHRAYLANGNTCGNNAVTAFLAHGTRPAHDITCPS